jgi:DNA-binding XRE family transcriptional regulator
LIENCFIAYRESMPARERAKGLPWNRRQPNNVQHLREERLLTKAELARLAGVSPLTVARVENGLDCRMDTKRKIILALGLQPTDRAIVFGPVRVRRGDGQE